MYLKVSSKPSVALKAKGFQVSGENLVNANGDYFHLPRSVKRALSAESAGKKVKPFQFLLKAEPSKAKKVSSPNEWWVHSQQIQYTTKLKESKPKFIVTSDAVSFFYNGKDYSTSKANPMFSKIVEHLKNNKMDDAVKLVDIANAVDASSNGLIKNQGGVLTHNDKALDDTVTNWLVSNMGRSDGSIQAVVNFLAKCNKNPSPGSVDMLWRFIRKNGLVLFPDGDFLGYRYVDDNLKDCYSGKFDNSPGKVCEMKREDVVYDPKYYCSPGLHVGAWSFVKDYSNIIEVKVNPEMVVSVPEGEDWKMRVCSFLSWKLLKHKGKEMAEKTENFVTL